MSTKKLQIVTPIVTSVNGKAGEVVLPIDDSLNSTSENPIQNKVVNSAISNINSLVGTSSVSSQISNAINGLATETYVNNKVAGIVNSAPETLDTLNELATALGNDPNFATTVATQIGTKVDKVSGKGLSTNDYTTTEKNKLAGIANGANKTIVDSSLSSSSTNPVQNKVVQSAISGKLDKSGGTITGQIALNGILVLSSATYGNTLPDSGVAGQIFFVKV